MRDIFNELEKYSDLIKLLCIIGLIIPMFYGINTEFAFSFIQLFDLSNIANSIITIFLVLIFPTLLFISITYLFFFLLGIKFPEKLSQFEDYHMVKIFSEKEFSSFNRRHILLSFSLNMILEELIFRVWILGLFLDVNVQYIYIALGVSKIALGFGFILIGSVIFSIYHLHMYIWTRSIPLTIFFVITSFFLGLILGIVLLYFGVILSIFIHWITVYSLYRFLSMYFSASSKKKYS